MSHHVGSGLQIEKDITDSSEKKGEGEPHMKGLEPLPNRPPPIGSAEHETRCEKAQALMREMGFSVLLVEPGSSLAYYTGINWWRSERLTCAIIPSTGPIILVTPYLEEPTIREALVIPAQIYTWLEHEDPLALVADIIRSFQSDFNAIGIENTTRYFIVDGLRRHFSDSTIRNGAAVVQNCRMLKSRSEIALIQHATDITIAAYRYTVPRVRAGMCSADITSMMKAATVQLGGQSIFEMALIGEASAYPHGSNAPQIVSEGEIILMDCGCSVEGYQSDVSRTFVFGEPSQHQRQVWEQAREGQQVAFRAARIGVAAGSVDDSLRQHYEKLGYGPGYELPGLSHRTGHGIGLDGHEPINLVRGETGVLQVGMCFSNEPGIYIPGAFGVRIEDCFYMTEDGPHWFSQPPATIEDPI